MPRLLPAHPALGLLLGLLCALPAAANPPVHALDNGTVRAEVTDAIGGRLLSFARAGRPNFLRLDLAAGDPSAPVSADADNVGYLGHETWAGPQKQWWAHQDVNPARKAARAPWPPDPWLSLAKYTIKRVSASELVLDSPASPVNGLQFEKRYALVPGKPDSLRVEAGAINRRAAPVAWDIWFNTRVHGGTHVYVPVAAAGDVRIEAQPPSSGFAPPRHTLAGQVFTLDVPAAGQPRRRGKVFLQPAAGWMAGFRDGQAFIVQFQLQPKRAIHPDQGQVELYQDIDPAQAGSGLIEMEVHAPWRTLAPGARMDAAELWTLLPYAGPDTRAAHLAFLRIHARALGLDGL